jgi:hypothetical protein
LGIEGVAWSEQRIPTVVTLGFIDPEPLLYPFKYLHSYTHEAECTPFQTHYFSEKVVAPGNEPGTSGSVARNCDY